MMLMMISVVFRSKSIQLKVKRFNVIVANFFVRHYQQIVIRYKSWHDLEVNFFQSLEIFVSAMKFKNS
jgi:hypothetical protein